MRLEGMSRWHWTCRAWDRGKCGSMAKASEGTGRLMRKEAARRAVTPALSGLQSATLNAVDLLKDGIVSCPRPQWLDFSVS